MTESKPSIYQAALEIIRKTKDGKELSREDLKLVELTVNGMVDADGRAAFFTLLDRVRAGYTPEPFHGIEHMTYHPQRGFLFWKEQMIAHFGASYAATDEAAVYARELAERCQQLEAEGKPLNTRTVVWDWCGDNDDAHKD